MSGLSLIFVLAIAIIVMVLAISKLKVHPFFAIMTVSLVFGLIGGIPLVNKTVDGVTTLGIPAVIGAGFSGIFTSIGIVIILGALIGMVIESTGAAFKLADMIIRLIGSKNPQLAVQLMGWVVSIPVFCDSGFVVLNPIRRALVKKTKVSSVSMVVALSLGLHTTHVFIPPTPGPLAAANNLGLADHLLLVMGMGALCSITCMIGAYFFSKYIGKKIKSSEDTDIDSITQTYDELVASYGKLPSGFLSLAPIVMPIVLMALGSVAGMAGWPGLFGEFCRFLGTPIIALGVGVLFAIWQISTVGKLDKFTGITNESLKIVGPILFITAAGGVLGRVINETDIVPFIRTNAGAISVLGIFFPYILAALLKTAQGSGTVAMVISSGIIFPMLGVLGFDSTMGAVMCMMAIASGAMCVSHANDSYFWVVTNFGGMTPQQGYRTQTLGSLVQSLSAMAGVFILSLILL